MKTGVIILLVGKSATGKSTLCEYLNEHFGYKILKSYTTRAPRKNDARDKYTHVFVTKEKFDSLENKCAYTLFDDYEYCATDEQVDDSDVYVIDPKGVEYFRNHYSGNKTAVVVYLQAYDTETLIHHMEKRGDDVVTIKQRLANDKIEFDKFYDYNYMIPVSTPSIEADIVDMIKEREEKELFERMLP